MKPSLIIAIFVLFPILAGTGCTAARQYDGPARPSSDVSILIRQQGGWIHTIDGKWRGIGNLKRYEFLPGTHTLKVYYGPVGTFEHAEDYLTMSVDLKPGRTYDLIFTADEAKEKWNAFVIDALTGEMVSRDLQPEK